MRRDALAERKRPAVLEACRCSARPQLAARAGTSRADVARKLFHNLGHLLIFFFVGIATRHFHFQLPFQPYKSIFPVRCQPELFL
jgi:hypothetical protein